MIGKIAFWFLVVASAVCYVGSLIKAGDGTNNMMYLMLGFFGFAFCATMFAARMGYLS